MHPSRATRESVVMRLLLIAPELSKAEAQEALDRLYTGDWEPMFKRFAIPRHVAQTLVAATPSYQQMLEAVDHLLNTMGFTKAWLASQ